MKLKVYQDSNIDSIGYAHEGDAGIDLRSAEDCSIGVGRIHKVRTGTYVEIPDGYVGIQAGRSGEGSRGHNLALGIGVIDSGYRGEILSPMMNNSDESWHISRNDRIAQLLIIPVEHAEIIRVASLSELSDTERGADGYGSTGVA